MLLIASMFCLQFPTQNSLSEGMIPVFYHDKIPARSGEARNAVLLSILLLIKHQYVHYLAVRSWQSDPNKFPSFGSESCQICNKIHSLYLETESKCTKWNIIMHTMEELKISSTIWCSSQNFLCYNWPLCDLKTSKCLMNHWMWVHKYNFHVTIQSLLFCLRWLPTVLTESTPEKGWWTKNEVFVSTLGLSSWHSQ